MKRIITAILISCASVLTLGCASKATDEQIGEMCKKKLELTGESRGTSEEEALAKIEEEFKFKAQKMKDDVARDLKGWDDVHKQQLADLEKQEFVPLTEEEAKEREEPVKTSEEMKEEKKQKLLASYEKNKKMLKEEFEKFFNKLGPQKEIAVRKAKEYTAERQEKAAKALEKCLAKTKEEEITEEVAKCRAQADAKDKYRACK
ncbi:MAG: hypothetical protein GY854_32770 [Deltaproteobacteria bacterium]|nr:hypothetical protein [Deltaproteobacteria bacterium]